MSGPAVLSLLADHALRLEADPALLPLLRRWLPLLPYDESPPDPAPPGAAIRVRRGEASIPPRPEGPPLLRLGPVDAWVDGGVLELRGDGGCAGRGELEDGSVVLVAPRETEGAAAAAWDLYSMATLSAALLLGRMGRALVHAAAVVEPGGGCLLLAGDTHAGKSTTAVNLIGAGWEFVSDDHVVLYRDPGSGAVRVEGWPRRFHLDEGWEEGEPGRRRGEIDPHERWPGRWRRTAPLAGLLFPRVEADLPTALSPLPASEALAGLLRQSPWLLADRGAAAGVLELLTAACRRPASALRLGRDTYRDAGRLAGVLRPAPAPPGR
ncbi:MAG TPA: hypothetical protein VF746_12200 [Longimicrobium sp.]